MTKRILISFVLLLQLTTIFSQTENIRFKRITINDGLSLSSVYAVYQDSKGFMWFGTEDGLNRFDGKNIEIFRPDISTKNTICYKWIEHIAEDSTGMLWFGSKAGLSAFNPKKEIFHNFKKNRDTSGLVNDSITHLFVDTRNNVWVGTLNGLNKINPSTLTIESIGNSKNVGLNSRIYNVVESKNNGVWITSNSGLYFYSYESKTCQKIPLVFNGKSIHQISSIVEVNNSFFIGTRNGLFTINQENLSTDSNILKELKFDKENHTITVETLLLEEQNNKLWITSRNRLYYLDLKSKKLFQILETFDSTNSLSINTFKPLHKDIEGNIWYGTFGNGLFKIDSKDGSISRFYHNPGNQTSISENSINCLYEDKHGSLWIGTFGAGISIYNPRSHKFELITHNPSNNNSLASNFIWTAFEDNKGDVWIGTNDKGITKYSPESNKYSIYNHNPNNSKSVAASSVRDIFQDSKGRIWIGTDGGGLDRYIPENNEFIHYKHNKKNHLSISDNSVRVIYEDNYGKLWVGTKNGLNSFNPSSGTFKRYLHITDDSQSISHNFVYATIYQDRKDNLWIGTYGGGLNIMDYKTEKFTHYKHNPDNPNSLSDNIVFAIYEEPDSEFFWLGTNNGLDRFNPKTNEFTRFGLEEGIPNEIIYSILPDDEGNIWLSTNQGICRFNIETHEVKNFDVNDGLQSNEFNGGAFHKGKSGNLYFGGVYGLNIIKPGVIKPEPILDKLTITGFEVLGKEVIVDIESTEENNFVKSEENHFTISENIAYTDEIILDYENRFFSLEFSSLGDINSNKINYSYKMEGLENNWHFSGDRNYVSYANMSPGKYRFWLRAQNADGVWSAPTKVLDIHVNPPFWKTPWFYILEIFIILGIIFFIYAYLMRIKTNKILTIQNKKISDVNEKLVESEKNLTELNATKDKFFSIIAHDLKNPFASLLSVGEVIHDNYKDLDDEERHKGIRQIYDSATNINTLLENLLTWSRSQSKRIKFEPVNFNLSKLIDETRLLYKNEAENKNVSLNAKCKDDAIAYGDRDMLNTVVRNLVNNAIKFCSKGDSVNIELEDSNNHYDVYVKDTGTGICQENLDKLFKIDRKLKTTGTAGEKGTGLGLILCKEFVERNNGQISVESEQGKGSTFKVTIPKST